MSRISKAHIWVGFTRKKRREFDIYFDQSAAFLFGSTGKEKNPSEVELSQFSKDLKKEHSFNEDFLSIYYAGEEPLEIGELLAEMEDISSPELSKKHVLQLELQKRMPFFSIQTPI
ncbi:MAG: hypothetical protein K0R59_2000 [Sphingobacterium sp.]|jgi:hypothetical protein|uniref:immunity 22 family protein n=1 Tax=unclassified Sphingobacterium TaxID=2609468 RepID=UPI0009847CC0|nr:immunity 22 family protein [Sphingobacterium sp. CZ-UAM]MDF2516704.1 hypothetical protein [Sphingobacterium sp.]OOG16375.1 hypothetical protein BWD42_21810 [Sphingobacterium sp. CZ-UAM]